MSWWGSENEKDGNLDLIRDSFAFYYDDVCHQKKQLICIIKHEIRSSSPFAVLSLFSRLLHEVINSQHPSVILLSTTRKCDNRIMITFHHHFKVPSLFFFLLCFFSLSLQIVREFCRRLNWFSVRARILSWTSVFKFKSVSCAKL